MRAAPRAFLGEHRVVIAVNHVVDDTRMLGLFLENRSSISQHLIGKRFIGFGSSNGMCESVKDGGFAVVWIGRPNGLTERLTQGASGTPSMGRNA